MNYQDFINDISRKLFEAERRRLRKMVTDLVIRNAEYKDASGAFFYAGIVYVGDATIVGKRGQAAIKTPTLHPNLEPSFMAYLGDKQQIDADEQEIKQILFQLLHQCNDFQEMRDALPECLVAYEPKFAGLSRQFNQRHFFFHNARVERQYFKVLPKIEMYAASRLLY